MDTSKSYFCSCFEQQVTLEHCGQLIAVAVEGDPCLDCKTYCKKLGEAGAEIGADEGHDDTTVAIAWSQQNSTTVRMVPLKVLQASERQTLRLLGLVHDMGKLLRDNPCDGSADLISKADAVEAGIDTTTNNSASAQA